MSLKEIRHEVDKIKLYQTLNFCIVKNQQNQRKHQKWGIKIRICKELKKKNPKQRKTSSNHKNEQMTSIGSFQMCKDTEKITQLH